MTSLAIVGAGTVLTGDFRDPVNHDADTIVVRDRALISKVGRREDLQAELADVDTDCGRRRSHPGTRPDRLALPCRPRRLHAASEDSGLPRQPRPWRHHARRLPGARSTCKVARTTRQGSKPWLLRLSRSFSELSPERHDCPRRRGRFRTHADLTATSPSSRR